MPSLYQRSHEPGLAVRAPTLISNQNSPDDLSPGYETLRMYDLGVDAIFADNPAQVVRIRAERKQN
jgi:glycerophosphoryl diester phosphodiesterase